MPAAKEMSDAINGDNRTSWHLPLPPLNSSSLEPHSPGTPLVVCPGCSIATVSAINVLALHKEKARQAGFAHTVHSTVRSQQEVP